jgi:hypothetical protein
MRAKPVDPEANGFAADDNAAFGQQILDIRRAQRKTMIGPDRCCHVNSRRVSKLCCRWYIKRHSLRISTLRMLRADGNGW